MTAGSSIKRLPFLHMGSSSNGRADLGWVVNDLTDFFGRLVFSAKNFEAARTVLCRFRGHPKAASFPGSKMPFSGQEVLDGHNDRAAVTSSAERMDASGRYTRHEHNGSTFNDV